MGRRVSVMELFSEKIRGVIAYLLLNSYKLNTSNFKLKTKKEGIKKKVNPVSRGNVVPGPIKS